MPCSAIPGAPRRAVLVGTDAMTSRALSPDAVVGIVGAGAMGAGIAQVAAVAGHRVRLLDAREGAAAQAVGQIRATLARLADKGRITRADAEAAAERLSAVARIGELAPARLVVEAIVERLDAKHALFAELEAVVADDAILATNTSSLSVTAVAAGLRVPARVVGMHFFNPAPLMALVEVVSGLATAPDAAAVVHDTAAAWGKRPVHARSTPGFIVNRVARPFYAEGLRLLAEQAATPATLDAVMREAGGFRMGPFELMDLIGHDVNFAVTRSVFDAFFGDPRFTPSLIQQELVAAGRLGRKSGQGFYDHAEGAPRELPQTCATAPAPAGRDVVVVWNGSPLGRALGRRLVAGAIRVELREGRGPQDRVAEAGAGVLLLTDGRSATQRAADLALADVVLADLVLDADTAPRIAVAAADQASQAGVDALVRVLQSAGFVVSRLDDVPGLAVMRTVAMLANEAADAVHQGVCDAAGADLAMQAGVNYPRGPLAWADALGPAAVLTVLDHLARAYGEDRYRASPLLRRVAAAGGRFHR
jgi:3-hydroxybutyryl-CoA dehydrogenase